MLETGGKNIIEWPTGRLDFSKGCVLMGVLNITPDSFSDGGKYLKVDKAVEKAVEMANEGAAIIDIGAESTQPGSEGVSADEQITRAIPVIKRLSEKIDVP
ncbi:MAG: dihydropteroate synthase, partial [Planctomycetota bacterium]